MSWVAAIIFYNIARIGEVELSRNGAKGLRLLDLQRARVHSSGVLVFTKKEKKKKDQSSPLKI
jgi:hypothetical protein